MLGSLASERLTKWGSSFTQEGDSVAVQLNGYQPIVRNLRFIQVQGRSRTLSGRKGDVVLCFRVRSLWLLFFDLVGFPCVLVVENSPCNAGDTALIPQLGGFPGGGRGSPLQYSYLKNPHGQRSLVGYRLWGGKESDTTEVTQHACMHLTLYSSLRHK